MSDTEETPICNVCAKLSSPNRPLKHCAKCKTQWYCSRECQKSDWKSHKQACSKHASETAATNPPQPNNAKRRDPLLPKNLSVRIAKPFHELDSKTWLHNRPEEDVYKLLIDVYRLRIDDKFHFLQKASPDSIYGGAADGRDGFARFLRRMEKGRKRVLLPPWWTPEHSQACIEFGMVEDGWSSLASKIDKSSIIKHYHERSFPMQMRLFAELIYGHGPGGESSVHMIPIMMKKEVGRPNAIW